MEHFHKLEDIAQKKSSSKTENSSPKVKECAGRTKRVAVKVSSSVAARKTPPSPNSSPNLDEETASSIPKRKRSRLERRPQSPLVLVLSKADLPDRPPAYQKRLYIAILRPVLTKTIIYPSRD